MKHLIHDDRFRIVYCVCDSEEPQLETLKQTYSKLEFLLQVPYDEADLILEDKR